MTWRSGGSSLGGGREERFGLLATEEEEEEEESPRNWKSEMRRSAHLLVAEIEPPVVTEE